MVVNGSGHEGHVVVKGGSGHEGHVVVNGSGHEGHVVVVSCLPAISATCTVYLTTTSA